MKVHYPKLYNMAHLSLNVFTASKGSNNYILFIYPSFHESCHVFILCLFLSVFFVPLP